MRIAVPPLQSSPPRSTHSREQSFVTQSIALNSDDISHRDNLSIPAKFNGDNMVVELSRGCIDRIKSGELANDPVTVQVCSRLPLPWQLHPNCAVACR